MSTDYQLSRSKPELQGVKSETILDFINAVEQIRTEDMGQDFHSFMLLRHGYVIAEGWWEPYQSELPHVLFSLSKSFTSTAIGFAVMEGLLTVNDKVISYFKEECPKPSGFWSDMKIKDLLSMSTGQIVDTTQSMFESKDGNWAKAFFEIPVEKEPGTHFLYNTGATYMLSVIIQRITGSKLIEYLKPRLFEPLGIKDASWETCPRGYNTGGFGLRVKTEDIAKFGQLYLNKGMFQGKHILPPEWIEEATSYHSDNSSNGDADWQQGYGYQFWRCRHNAYRGDGAFGQYCIVMPEQDMVLAITGGMKDLQKPLSIVWEHLLPKVSEGELPESPAYDKLLEKLSSLKLMLPEGEISSPLMPKYEKLSYRMEENPDHIDMLSFEFNNESIHITIESMGTIIEGEIGIGAWIEGTFQFERELERMALTGIWQDETTLLVQCRFIEMPFAREYRFTFKEKKLVLETKVNVGFEEPKRSSMLGMKKQ